MPVAPPATLLAIVELGGYPNFTPLYQRAGYRVEVVGAMRKALGLVKKLKPRVIVAEFNFQPDFRERVSNLEPLLASVQRLPETRVIVFYEAAQQAQLEKLYARFPYFASLPYPVDAERLERLLNGDTAR